MLLEEMNPYPSSLSSSKFMADGVITSHTHKLISLRRSSSGNPFPHSRSSSGEDLNRSIKFRRISDGLPGRSRFSASMVAESEDLLTEILLCLLAKSIMRFQSVSKRWRSIILDSYFRRLRSERRRTGAYFLFIKDNMGTDLNFVSNCKEYVDPMSYSVSNFTNCFDLNRVLSFHSCNGLIAIALKSNEVDPVDCYVYNPITRCHRLIPGLYVHKDDLETNELICPQTESDFVGFNIVFDPSQFDHYRLLYIWWAGEGGLIRFASYSSETRIWTPSRWFYQEEDYRDTYFQQGVFWNGLVYWCTSWWSVLCFDLENGDNKLITAEIAGVLVPKGNFFWPDVFCFGLLGEDLCLSGMTKPRSWKFRVFTLARDHSSWNLKYCLNISPLLPLYPSMEIEKHYNDDPWWLYYTSAILSCHVNEKDQKPELLISIPGKIISFDMQNMIVKEVADVSPITYLSWDKSRFGWMRTFEHFETFASV